MLDSQYSPASGTSEPGLSSKINQPKKVQGEILVTWHVLLKFSLVGLLIAILVISGVIIRNHKNKDFPLESQISIDSD